jgi:phosphohistidine phosphatase
MKTVIIMRHAEAGRHSDDYERALTPVGQDEAKRSAARILAGAPPVDWAVASAAVRAQTTAELVLAALGSKAPLSCRETLYESGTEVYLDVLREAPQSASCVLLVGHNPTVSALAQRLLGQTISLGTSEWLAVSSSASEWKRFGRA